MLVMANHIDQKWSGSGISEGSLAYIRAHSQTLVFKEKSGEKETDDKKLAQKKAEQDRGGTQMYAGAHPMANHILIKSDRMY